MKYFNLKFLTFFLTALLAFGVGWAGTETVTFSEQYSTQTDMTISGYTGTTFTLSFSNGTNSAKPTYYTNGSAVRMYKSNTMTVSSSKTITKIELTFGSSDGTNEITTNVGTYSSGTWTGSVSSVVFTVGETTGNRRLSAVTVTTSDGPSLTPVTLSFPESSYTANVGEAFSAPTLTVAPAAAASEVVYSSSDTDVATVNASTGAVTIVAEGTTTITAAIDDSETYTNASASYTLTVKPDPNVLAILDFTSAEFWNPVLPIGSDNKTVDENEYSDGTYTVKIAGSQGEGYYWLSQGKDLLLGKNGAYLQLPAFDKPVAKIVIDGYSGASGKVTQNIYVGETAVSTETTSAKETHTYEIAPGYQAAGNIYTLKVTNDNNTQIQKIYIYFKEETGEPELLLTPEELTIGEAGGTLTVNGSNLGSDPGVFLINETGYSDQFAFSLQGVDEGQSWFPRTDGAVTNGKVDVTYNGYELTAKGKIGVNINNTGDGASSIVNYKIDDIYIVGDYGINEGWNFTDGTNRMSDNGGVFTYELNVNNTNTYIAFAKKVGNDVGFNTRYVFTPVSDNNWEMDADSKEGTINVYGAKPIHFQYAGLYVIEINTNNSPATFTITRTLPQVEKPKFTPNGGNFPASQTVALSCDTDGASIYYTTDESEPSAENGNLYEGEITLTSTTTLKAIAVKEGMRPSEVATATFTKTGIDNLAGVNALGNSKNFTFVGNVVVTFKGTYGNHTLVGLRDVSQNNADGHGGGVFHNTATDLTVGQVLKPGWTGKTNVYAGLTQIENADGIELAAEPAEVLPFERSGFEFTAENLSEHISEYIILRNITISDDENNSNPAYKLATWNDGTKTVVYTLFDRFSVDYEDGDYEYLIGVVNVYNNTIQVYPLELKEVVKPLAVTLPEAPAENYKVGQVVKVKATVENGSDNTVLTYKVGEETLTPDNEGNVTLPNKKSGEVILTVTAVDGEKSDSDTKIYVFDKADALTIKLNPATFTYTVGDDAKVTVTVENAIGTPTITYKFTEEGEAQAYPEGGIVLPTNEAGTINLTVMVDDEGYEHNGATTATGTYTVNHKALSVTLNPANNEYTVGDEAKVKVTVENAVGEYVVSGKIGEKDYDVDENGYITLPNDKAVEEMILTVTAIDNRENAVVATATGTYKFNAAPAITFDLEIVPEAENNAYAVGDEVKVKATNIKNTIGDYEVTYMVGQNKLTPNNDGYVTFTSEVADEVNLTVSVDDLFEHESEATQTVKFTFDKKEAKVEYSAETGTATFGVEPENLPKLTVTPTGLPVIYESTNTAVATVNENGEVSIKGAGKTTISAAFKGNDMYEPASDSYELTVAQGAAGLSYPEGTSVTATVGDNNVVKPTLNNPNELPVTWSSDNESVATVDAEGNVTIVGPGTTTITATYTAGEGSNYATGEASYTITVNDVVVALAAPTFAPAAGTYTEPKEVAIACATPGVTITYAIDGVDKGEYNGPFTISDGEHTVTATAMMGTRTVYTPATSSATYKINVKAPAAIENNYYFLQSNAAEVSGKYANVAGRRTLNFVADADKQAGTVFRIETGEGGAVKTLRSQAVDLQGYANRAMAYVPKAIELVLGTLANSSLGDPETPGTGILGENGVQLILKKFYDNFDYNLYVEQGTEGTYRIYGRTPSMQHVVDFYHENTAQVEEKLPMLEDYINQVLDKIRSKIPAPYDANVVVPFSLKTVRDRIADKYGITLIDPTQDLMGFYRQVLNNKEYVWDFAYQTAMMYVDVIKETQTYKNLPDEYKLYVTKMEKVRPDTKYYIIERGNELDYISENNGEIISNDPRTLWTLTPRENFTVNVPEANKLNDSYYTTLYTDFAYTLPEGVNAYAVTGIDENDVAQLAELSSPIAAQTPVLLKANAAGTVNVTLTTAAGNTPETNLLEGPDYLVKTYGITSPTVEAIFNLAAAFVPADMLAEYEYLQLRYSGTVNNKYFWNVNSDLEDLQGDCVVRSLAVKDGTLAFSEHWTTETNKAFLVSDTKPVIYLEKETLAAPTFSPVPGSYTVNNGESVTITITAEDGATIYYKIGDGEYQRYNGPITASDDMTIVAKAEKDGMIASDEVTAVYVIDNPTVLPDVPAMKGYYQIKNNGNSKYANVAGRKTLNFVEDPADKAGTVIWLETNDKGQVQSLRSQAADLQRYADRVVEYYVPKAVELVVEKLHADGAGNILGENGLDAIMDKFNESFDHHLYVEEAQDGYRIYGKTPSMQPVVEFYREHTAQVEAKLPMLEDFINSALDKLKEKIGGQSVFQPFSLLNIWERMGGTLTKPEDDASIMAFYREVLNNKNYVWDFAYQTATFYLENLKSHQRWPEVEAMMGEYAQYFNKLEQVRPDFKYYIVADGDKPDFISEGNVDIINNEARTIWTVEPRTTFTVNIAENNLFGCPLADGVGGYATTLYTDFAYTVPDGVTAYKVTSIDGGKATIEALSDVIPAQTPVLLTAKEAGTVTLTLSTEAGTAVTGNLLYGPDYLINEYDLKTEQVQSLFDQIKAKMGQSFYDTYVAQYEYLADLNSGTVNNKYFWGLKQSDVEKCSNDGGEDCVVRNLSGDKFIDNWKVETNKAFLVTDEYNEITFNTLHGDVNHDGLVNIEDVTDLIDRLLGMPDAYHLKACEYCSDVNKNGTVKIDDVTTLIDILLGIDGSNQATDPQGGE